MLTNQNKTNLPKHVYASVWKMSLIQKLNELANPQPLFLDPEDNIDGLCFFAVNNLMEIQSAQILDV